MLGFILHSRQLELTVKNCLAHDQITQAQYQNFTKEGIVRLTPAQARILRDTYDKSVNVQHQAVVDIIRLIKEEEAERRRVRAQEEEERVRKRAEQKALKEQEEERKRIEQEAYRQASALEQERIIQARVEEFRVNSRAELEKVRKQRQDALDIKQGRLAGQYAGEALEGELIKLIEEEDQDEKIKCDEFLEELLSYEYFNWPQDVLIPTADLPRYASILDWSGAEFAYEKRLKLIRRVLSKINLNMNYEQCKEKYNTDEAPKDFKNYLEDYKINVGFGCWISFKTLFVIFMNSLDDEAASIESAALAQCAKGVADYFIDRLEVIFPDEKELLKEKYLRMLQDKFRVYDIDSWKELLRENPDLLTSQEKEEITNNRKLTPERCEKLIEKCMKGLGKELKAEDPSLDKMSIIVPWEKIKAFNNFREDFFESIADDKEVVEEEGAEERKGLFVSLNIKKSDRDYAAPLSADILKRFALARDPNPHAELNKKIAIIVTQFYKRLMYLQNKLNIVPKSSKECRDYLISCISSQERAVAQNLKLDEELHGTKVWDIPENSAMLSVSAYYGSIWAIRFGREGNQCSSGIPAHSFPVGTITMAQLVSYAASKKTNSDIVRFLTAIIDDGREACGPGKIIRGIMTLAYLPEFRYDNYDQYDGE